MNIDVLLQYEPEINKKDIKAINYYLHSGGFITEFRKTDLFEKRIKDPIKKMAVNVIIFCLRIIYCFFKSTKWQKKDP